MAIQLLNINTSSTIYTKSSSGRFTSVPRENITYKVHVQDGAVASIGYVVNGTEYDALYKKSDDSVTMQLLCVVSTGIGFDLICKQTGCFRSVFFDGNLDATLYKADGTITESVYHLPDGEYDAVNKYCSVMLKLDVSMEDIGYPNEDFAKFFNSYTADGELHPAQASKVVPTKQKIRIGMTAIAKMFETLEKNGLMFVYNSDTERIGVINKLSTDEFVMDDTNTVPDLAIPLYTRANNITVSESWNIKLVEHQQ